MAKVRFHVATGAVRCWDHDATGCLLVVSRPGRPDGGWRRPEMMWSTETAGPGRACHTRAWGPWRTDWLVSGGSLSIVAELRAVRGRQQRGGYSSGFLELVALCTVKPHNLLAGEEGNTFGKFVLYDDFYLVENSYAKFVLGSKKRYPFIVT